MADIGYTNKPQIRPKRPLFGRKRDVIGCYDIREFRTSDERPPGAKVTLVAPVVPSPPGGLFDRKEARAQHLEGGRAREPGARPGCLWPMARAPSGGASSGHQRGRDRRRSMTTDKTSAHGLEQPHRKSRDPTTTGKWLKYETDDGRSPPDSQRYFHARPISVTKTEYRIPAMVVLVRRGRRVMMIFATLISPVMFCCRRHVLEPVASTVDARQAVHHGVVGELQAARSAAWSLAGSRPDRGARQCIPGVKRTGLNHLSDCVLEGVDIGDRVVDRRRRVPWGIGADPRRLAGSAGGVAIGRPRGGSAASAACAGRTR